MTKTNTHAAQGTKAPKENTNKAPKAAEAKAQAGKKGNYKSLDNAGAVTIAGALLRDYKSIGGIKRHEAELIAKYGKDNFKAIKAAAQDQRQGEIKLNAGAVEKGLRELSPALAEAWRAARKGGNFAKLEALAAAKYGSPEAFIAACYPHTIDGAPAVKAYYVTAQGGTILAAYKPAKFDGITARKAVYDTFEAFKKALTKAEAKGKVFEAPGKAEAAGAIVAAYNAKAAEKGTICKGEAVSPEELAQYKRGNVSGLETLSAYNREARKLWELAQAAEALAIATGSPEELAQAEAAKARAKGPKAKAAPQPEAVSPAPAQAEAAKAPGLWGRIFGSRKAAPALA